MRRRHHRQFGLSNANQILLCIAVCTLLFFALLRHNWLNFEEDPAIYASLKRVYISNNEVTDSISWETFCADNSFNMIIPGTNETIPVVSMQDGAVLCHKHTNGELVPGLMLGNPTREMVFWIGMLPGILLFGAAVLGTTSLFLWQRYYLRFNNGDCFSITVAATVIAYATAISMVIRWRWPGICAVPNEQQVIGSRSYRVHLTRSRGRRRESAGAAATINSAPTRDLESIAVPLNR